MATSTFSIAGDYPKFAYDVVGVITHTDNNVTDKNWALLAIHLPIDGNVFQLERGINLSTSAGNRLLVIMRDQQGADYYGSSCAFTDYIALHINIGKSVLSTPDDTDDLTYIPIDYTQPIEVVLYHDNDISHADAVTYAEDIYHGTPPTAEGKSPLIPARRGVGLIRP